MQRLAFITLSATVGVALLTPRPTPVVAQAPDPTVVAILAEWGQRHKGISSIKFVLRGERTVPKGIIIHDERRKPLAVPLPREDVTTPLKRTFLLDLAKGRFRLEIDEQGYSREGLHPIRRTDTFDGSAYRVLNPKDPNAELRHGKGLVPDIAVGTGNAAVREFELIHWPMFNGLGIVQSYFYSRSTAKTFIPEWDPELLRVHGEAVHQGRRCIILRTYPRGGGAGNFEEYWVDRARASAVVKYLLIVGKIAEFEIVVDYRKTARGWHPSGWVYTRRDSQAKGKVQDLEKVSVAETVFDLPVSDGDFTFDERPGMVAVKLHFRPPDPQSSNRDYQLERENVYRQGEDGTWQELDKTTGEPLAVRRYWVVALLAGVLGVVFLWFFARKLGRARAQTG